MSLDWSTLALQAVNFLVLVWLLQRFLYRPVLAAIDRRRAETSALQTQAADAQAKAEAAEREWHDRQRAFEAEIAGLRHAAEADAQRRADAVLAEAHLQAERILADGRVALAAERRAVRADLEHLAAALSTRLAARLLAVVAPGVGAAPFLSLLEQGWTALPADQRALLAGARLEVAPPLGVAEQEHWRQRLGAADVAERPDLIAGAALVGRSAVLQVSWADALAKAEAGMVSDADLDG